MPRTSKPTSIRLAPKVRESLLHIAQSRRWSLTQTMQVAFEEMIGRYLFNRKIRLKKPADGKPVDDSDLDFSKH